MAEFQRDGLSFQYPATWKLETQDSDTGWTVTVQSPDTAFLLLSFDSDMPEPENMAQAALDAMREEYPELEAEEKVETLAGQPALGHDIQFFSFDLTNTCCLRSFFAGQGTALLMWQANDLELEINGPILRGVCASLGITDE